MPRPSKACKEPRDRIGDPLKSNPDLKKCLIPCHKLKRPEKAKKRCVKNVQGKWEGKEERAERMLYGDFPDVAKEGVEEQEEREVREEDEAIKKGVCVDRLERTIKDAYSTLKYLADDDNYKRTKNKADMLNEVIDTYNYFLRHKDRDDVRNCLKSTEWGKLRDFVWHKKWKRLKLKDPKGWIKWEGGERFEPEGYHFKKMYYKKDTPTKTKQASKRADMTLKTLERKAAKIEKKQKEIEKEEKELGKNMEKLKKQRGGKTLVDTFLQKACPAELHMLDMSKGYPRRYEFCGPCTKLDKRLKRGDTGIKIKGKTSKLDAGCKLHDIAYANPDLSARKPADRALMKVADEVGADKNANWSERANAKLVKKVFQTKLALGQGISGEGCGCGCADCSGGKFQHPKAKPKPKPKAKKQVKIHTGYSHPLESREAFAALLLGKDRMTVA